MALGFGGNVVARTEAVLTLDKSAFSRDVKSADREFTSLGRSVDQGSKRMHLSLKSLVGLAGATGAFYELGKAAKAGFAELEQGQKVTAQTNAVIKSTGDVSNVSAQHVDALGTALLRKSGIDDEAIKSGENMLLTFTNIRNEVGRGNDIFDQSTKILLDMSVALGTDMSHSAIQLGKALNDPVRGVTALTRVGVTFDTQQRKQIKTLEESGHTIEAQKIILHELNKEFGGSAEAAGKTLPGQWAIFRESLRNTESDIEDRFLPVFTDIVAVADKDILPALDRVDSFIGKVFKQRSFAAKVRVAAEGLESIATSIRNRIEKAIENVNWTQIGGIVSRNLGSGLTFSVEAGGNLLTSLINAIDRNTEKILGVAERIVSTLADAVSRSSTQLANVGALLIAKIFATLTDPSFWIHHWQLAIAVGLTVFPVGRLAGIGEKVGLAVLRPLARILPDGFRTFGGRAIDALLEVLGRLPGRAQAAFLALVDIVARAFGSIISKVKELGQVFDGLPRLLRVAAFSAAINAIKAVFISGFRQILNLIDKFLGGMQAMAEGASHIPFIGSKFDGVADAIGRAREKLRRFNEDLDKTPDKTIRVTFTIGGTSFTERISGPGGSASVRFTPFGGPRAMGGRIPGAPVAADNTLALLSPGEFVVTRGGERMLEALTGVPGVLNWLERNQPPHFQTGGRAFTDELGSRGGEAIKAASAQVGHSSLAALVKQLTSLLTPPAGPTAGPGGPINVHGLVAQVLRAISWARAHGWRGSVTSGFRSYAQQVDIWERSGHGTLFAAAPPGRSEHEFGRAIDVSDIAGFRRAMATAPASARLYQSAWIRSHDPVHFSVSGNRRGGRIGRILGFQRGGRVKTSSEDVPPFFLRRARQARQLIGKKSKGATGIPPIDATLGQWDAGQDNLTNLGYDLDKAQALEQEDESNPLTKTEVAIDPITGEKVEYQVIDTDAVKRRVDLLGRVKDIQDQIVAVWQRLQALAAKLKAQADEWRVKLQNKIKQLKDDIARITNIVAGLKLVRRIAPKEVDFADLDDRIKAYENVLGTDKGELKDFTDRLTNLNNLDFKDTYNVRRLDAEETRAEIDSRSTAQMIQAVQAMRSETPAFSGGTAGGGEGLGLSDLLSDEGGGGGEGLSAEDRLSSIQTYIATRAGFLAQFASNIFTPTKAGLISGSAGLQGATGPGTAPTVTQQISFTQPPENTFQWLQSSAFHAKVAFS